ncbi:TetR/AcrR family transcriptional regulator [Gordonia sp. (in: high G+C Gram-positive bacteria)]|uniref:TetR/AcrR family transcriptional regulator n=1 Tax=unclassified Gordonia (in: high G+C Gram-positive bacteria) TaxID=2657482 RepID=UPI00352940BF
MAYRQTEATRASAQAKRDAMLAAARELVGEAGFAGATVAAIAARCGVSVGSVYSYFDNRDALLAEVFRESAEYEFACVRRAVDAAGPDAGAQLAALIDTFADRALRGRRTAWSLLFEPVIPAVDAERLRLRQSYRDLGERIIGDGIESGLLIRQDVPVVAGAVMGAISEALIGALNPDLAGVVDRGDQAALVATIRRFCFRALGARPFPE